MGFEVVVAVLRKGARPVVPVRRRRPLPRRQRLFVRQGGAVFEVVAVGETVAPDYGEVGPGLLDDARGDGRVPYSLRLPAPSRPGLSRLPSLLLLADLASVERP